MKKPFFTVALFAIAAFSTCAVKAQTQIDSLKTVDNPLNPEKKLKLGLGFGLNFVGGTSLSLSPNLTYKINDKMAAGAGLLFNYNAVKNLQTTTTVGANVLYFYTPIEKLITTAEFAEMYVNRDLKFSGIKDNFWDTALFVGAGYQITPKISAGAKYNLLYNKNKSVYSSPFVPFVNISF